MRVICCMKIRNWYSANVKLYVVPLFVFTGAFKAVMAARKRVMNEVKVNAIVASFLMLDFDGDNTLSQKEFQKIFRWKDLVSFHVFLAKVNKKLSNKMTFKNNSVDDDGNNSFTLSLNDYIDAVLTNRLSFNISSNVVLTSKLQALFECKIIYHPFFDVCSILIGILPGMIGALLLGLSGVSETFIDVLLLISFIYNIIEISMKMWCYGWCKSNNSFFIKFRFFDLRAYEDPPFVQFCSFTNMKDLTFKNPNSNYIPQSLLYLTHDEWKWAIKNLSKNNFINSKTSSITVRRAKTMTNRFDFAVLFIALLCILWNVIVVNYFDSNSSSSSSSSSSSMYDMKNNRVYLLASLTRLFTLVGWNVGILSEITTVLSQSISLMLFAFLYLFVWARIGVYLFGGETDVVLYDIYSTNAHTSFDTLLNAILSLMQVLFGNSWSSIMYYNVLATRYLYAFYFAIYVLVVTFLFAKIVNSLTIAGIIASTSHLTAKSKEEQSVNSQYKIKLTALAKWKAKHRLSQRF